MPSKISTIWSREPTKDTFSVHCGYENYNLLLIELLEDGHYKYSCLNGILS